MTIETANRLYELRKKHNLSQEELAEKLGVSRQAVSKWERSEASPDTDNLIALAKIYDLSLDELIYGEKQEDKAETEPEPESKSENDTSDKSGGGDEVKIKPFGIHVKSDEGDEVDINLSGIHVKSKEGDRVNIGLKGINIYTHNDDEDDEDDTIVKEGHFHFEVDKPSNIGLWLEVPYCILCLVAYLLFGFYNVCGGWALSWIIFITIPIFNSLIEAIYNKRFSEFSYAVFTVFAYLYIGLYHGVWHPGWVIFLTIPIYYPIAYAIDRKVKEKSKIKDEQEEQSK